jgi:hypothetical protein
MGLFLVISACILVFSGAAFLLAPKLIKTLADITNVTIFSFEDKLFEHRRLLGIIFLALSVYLWITWLTCKGS